MYFKDRQITLKTRLKTAIKQSDKIIMRIAYSLSFIFLFSSCNLNLQEKAKTYIKVSTGSTTCLADFSTKLTKYFAGTISKQEFTQAWLCLTSSIEIFSSVIKSKKSNRFTVDEIFIYLARLLGDQPQASVALKTETIALKKWLVGGRDTISKVELQQIATLLKNMLPSLLVLLDNMEFYNLLQADSTVEAILNKYSWEEIKTRLQKSKNSLTLAFNNAKSFKPKTTYSVTHFKNFLFQIGFFFENGKQSLAAVFFQEQEALFKAVQAMLFPQSKLLDKGYFSAFQWKSLMRFFSNSYPLFVQYKFSIQKHNLFQVEKLDYFILWLKESLGLAKSVINNHPEQTITYAQLMPMFEVLYDKGLLPFKMTNKLLEIFIVKFFTPVEHRKNKKGLDKISLKAIQQTLDRWARAQIILSGSVDKKAFAYLNKRKSTKDFEYFRQLLSIIQNNIYVFDATKSASFYKNGSPSNISFYNLLIHNNLLGVVEKIFYAYSSSYAKAVDSKQKGLLFTNFGLTPFEIKQLTTDTLQLAKTFGVKIPVQASQISELIRVLAQFFSYSAKGAVVKSITEDVPCSVLCDGDEGQRVVRKVVSNSLSFIEVFEFLGIAYSALQKSTTQFANIKTICTKNCRAVFFKQLTTSTEFPILFKYFKTNSPEVKKEFFDLLADALFQNQNTITQSKLFLSYAVFYFIESVMLRYDKDSSGVLEASELNDALKIFEGLVIQLLKSQDPDKETGAASIRQAFHFALTMPLNSTFWDKASFVLNPPPFEANPFSLAKVLSAIVK